MREKGGKQMQDSLKKILSASSSSAAKQLVDGDVVVTKAAGKLKSRYVLHVVAPSWSKCVVEKQNVAEFEPRMEKTVQNVLKQAHDVTLGLQSIGFPVASAKAGGAFDMPVSLFGHLLYTQLARFELNEMMNVEMKKVCICSMEIDVVRQLIEVFGNYTDMCEQTSWAIPESPMNSLVNELYPNEFDLLRPTFSPGRNGYINRLIVEILILYVL